MLRDRLGALDVPVVGGIDVGHGTDPLSVPRPVAKLDGDTLTVGPAVS